MAITTLAGFVEGIYQSRLLDAEQRAEVQRLQTSVHDSRGLAQELLRREWLSAFQINQIFQGKGAGLTIGPYVLIERLGEGGMGQVYKARQKTLDRLVALKVIRKECLDNPKAVKRFQREIRAASQLCHPHIVRAYDADQIDGAYYFAMELIEGVDLSRLVKDKGPLPVDQACEYVRQAALGLQHALERGMVHRDIKPANLLVTKAVKSDRHRSSGTHRRPDLNAKQSNGAISRPDLNDYQWGVVKILDMGLARCTDPFTGQSATHLTQVGSVMGTPDFIAPEQARDSHSSDIRADLYSLGCTFYFLLTGRAPFPEGSLTDKLLQHQFDVAEPIVDVRKSHVPTAVVDLVGRLMAKDPVDRIQTPQELANTLQVLTKQLADGTLAREEMAAKVETEELRALVDVDLVSATAKPLPCVVTKPRNRAYGSLSLLVALAGGVCFVIVATVIAAVMGASNRTQAKPPDVPTKNVGSDPAAKKSARR